MTADNLINDDFVIRLGAAQKALEDYLGTCAGDNPNHNAYPDMQALHLVLLGVMQSLAGDDYAKLVSDHMALADHIKPAGPKEPTVIDLDDYRRIQ